MGRMHDSAHVRLGLRDRARAQPQQPPHRGDARQGAGRLLVDQRDGLYPRQPRRLRPLGAEGRARLVLCGRAAVLPARRDLGRRREHLARRLGPARHRIRQDARSAVRGLAGGRPGDRAFRRRPTTTASSRKVSAAASTPSATAAARRRRAPICGRRRTRGNLTVETGAHAHARAAAGHARDRRRIRQGRAATRAMPRPAAR